MLRQNSGAPIRLQYLQLMHSFGVATSARVYNTSQSSKLLRKTQQCQTKKLTVIGDGKGNCANAQPGFSGDRVVFSEARTKGSSGSYSEDGCFCYSSYWVRKECMLPVFASPP